ncbi:hypothetical protein AVEN_259008-1 [Araneus ventricosus]|uniref:Uncharacterized protein n=1 Tax=Araneus ventricosus TaxID=182803 RepID=A0A4Y2KHL1_ARAVE|nr:hypothetical protein AVEN_259008-1 [Araneus ventricosus]
MACLIGARLLHYLRSNTPLDHNAATLWIDSTVALSWIREGIQIVVKHSSATLQQKYFTMRHHHSDDIVQDLRTSESYFKRHFTSRTVIIGYSVEWSRLVESRSRQLAY